MHGGIQHDLRLRLLVRTLTGRCQCLQRAKLHASESRRVRLRCSKLRREANFLSTMDAKRKAISPCESQKQKTTRFYSPNSSLELSKLPDLVSPTSSIDFHSPRSDFNSTIDSMSSETPMDNDQVVSVSYTIENRNGEKFKGAVDRPTAKKIWEMGLNLPGNLIYGIALNQSMDRSFLIDYELKEAIDWCECLPTFDVEIDGVKYDGRKFAPKPRPPELGEEVVIRIKKTRFKLKPPQVTRWMEHFGVITKAPNFEDASDLPSVKADDILLTMKLRKHVPGILPAYGRKMIVFYPGQPILCGKCFELGHVRAKCEKEVAVKWISFVRVVSNEKFASKEMLGSWAELLEKEE